MTKWNIDKILKENIKHDDVVKEHLQDVNEQALWLQVALDEYLQDGDFDAFYMALEKVIEVRNISVTAMIGIGAMAVSVILFVGSVIYRG